jgi:hypothetical protein
MLTKKKKKVTLMTHLGKVLNILILKMSVVMWAIMYYLNKLTFQNIIK